jgi:uncharacterized membrane protein YcaP (DUF421 family)
MNNMDKVFQAVDLETLIQLFFLSVIMSLGSFIIIRLGGKKSVSQMTLPQTVIMISLGSLIITPFTEHTTVLGVLFCVLIFVLVMIFLEWISMKVNFLEMLIDSVPTLLVKDGQIQINNFKKTRMTLDQLESMLREKGISSIQDLRTCTLEINGNIGYEEKKKYNPNTPNIFDEVRDGKHKNKINKNLE